MALFPHDRRNYISQTRQVFWIALSGFVAFIILLTILELVGVPSPVIAFLFIFLPLFVYALFGIAARTLQVVEFYVAGRRIPEVFNGMAAAANWIGASVILGLTGSLVFSGFDGLALLLGWVSGFVLVAALFAPFLRKYGAFTVPDFLGARFGGSLIRISGIIVLVGSTSALMVAEFRAGGLIVAHTLNVTYGTGVLITMAAVLLCAVLGGIRGITWAQVAQFMVLFIAVIGTILLFSLNMTGNPFAPLAFGVLLDPIAEFETLHEVVGSQAPPAIDALKRLATPHSQPFATINAPGFMAITACVMLGTASLPHVLMRYFTSTSVNGARRSAGWTILFVVLVLSFIPAAAAMVKFTILGDVVGGAVANLPDWVGRWSELGLAQATDLNGDGRIGVGEFYMHPDAVLLALPEIGYMPFVATALIAAGILAAALSTASGLSLAIANGLSHDLYYRLVDGAASTAKRLLVARLCVIFVVLAAAWVAANHSLEILPLVGWSLSLAAAGNFSVLLLAIWWRRATHLGAVVGMIAGFGSTLLYLIGTQFLGWNTILGLGELSAGLIGVVISFALTICVSLATKAPSADLDALVDDIRIPRGQSYMERERAAERIREAGSAR